jgi:hypothetical protein
MTEKYYYDGELSIMILYKLWGQSFKIQYDLVTEMITDLIDQLVVTEACDSGRPVVVEI